MISGRKQKLALAAVLVSTLTACGNDTTSNDANPVMIAGQVAKGLAQQATKKDAPKTAARTPEQMAAEALAVNKGPLVLVGFETLGRNQVMAMTGQNGATRTYMAPSEEAVILRDGMLVGTRGLGNDLSVAEAPQIAALVRAGRSGQGQRVMRYFTGDGKERPLSFTCSVGPGPKAGVQVESCEGHGARFQNSYIAQGGQIMVSRQWVGPSLGYITVQTLR